MEKFVAKLPKESDRPMAGGIFITLVGSVLITEKTLTKLAKGGL